MRKLVCKGFCALSAAVAVQFGSTAMAVDTVADWTGRNSNASNATFTTGITNNNNYGIISPTSVGGAIQAKITYSTADPSVTDVNAENVFFSDHSLEGPTLDFTTPLHMSGTVTFNSPTATEPNILFGWYSSIDTRHRIGLGISNRSFNDGGAFANTLRWDFGYAATGGNSFPFVSTDGNQPSTSANSVIPNGTYPFTFDYTPGPSGQAGGTMSATVGTFFKTVQPLTTQPWDTDFFSFDRFGFVQRSTGTTASTVQLPFETYSITISNLDYTGGTEAAVTLLGDFNSSGNVNGTDLGIWQTNFATGTNLATGDADGDGDADGADYLIWQQNFNGGSPISSVPEPATLALLASAMLGLGLAGRRART